MNVDDVLKKSVVIFSTKYGTTQEVAQTMADQLGIPIKRTSDFESVDDLAQYDLVFLGAPIYYDDIHDDMKMFIHSFYPELDEKKKILFSVFGAVKGHLQRDYAEKFAGYFSKKPLLTVNFLGRARKDTMSQEDYKLLWVFYRNRLKTNMKDFDYFGQNNFENAAKAVRKAIQEKY